MTVGLDEIRRALEGRYAIERQIGEGGTAVVYLAEDLRHERLVAIKVLRSEIAVSIGADRFLREIRIVSQLTHPHILPLHDSGWAEEYLFYVMPYVDGHSLRDILKEHRALSVDEILRLAGQVADALDFAHGHGIVHRDIKPENILIEAGHAVVADFGIARAIDVATGDAVTSSTFATGTPAYMSPEQRSGQGHIDGRSDQYSLACVVQEMLTGGVGNEPTAPRAPRTRGPGGSTPRVRGVRPAAPEFVEDALRRGLSVDPADRYPTVSEFVSALRQPVQSSSRHVGVLLLSVLAIASVLLAVLVEAERRKGGAPGITGDRVVVAEFVNRTADPKLDPIGLMAADWITEGLQRTGTLDVVPMLTAFEASRFLRARADSARSLLNGLRDETGARIIVSGSFYRKGDTLSFQSQIADVNTDRLLGAIGPISAPTSDPGAAIMELRARAMGLLASTTDERLASSAGLGSAPPTYDAYRQFSAGMLDYINSDFADATTHLTRAFLTDTTFPTPLLFASISLSNQGRYTEADSIAHVLGSMRTRLNPFYQDWLDYRLALLAGDRPTALAAVRRLAGRAPGSKATYNLAVEALENGHVSEAILALRSLPADRGPMRGWIPYWELLGTAYHLMADYQAELSAGAEARAGYPGRLFALLPSVRALTALGRRTELDRLLTDAAGFGRDPYGTTLGVLLREAGDEALAHGQATAARRYFARSLGWYSARIAEKGASPADTLATASVLYSLGHYADAGALIRSQPNSKEAIGLAGLIAAQLGQAAEARALAARLAEDRTPYQFGALYVAEARIEGVLGDTAMALTALEHAFSAGRQYDLWMHRTPEFGLLRQSPRFQELVRPKP